MRELRNPWTSPVYQTGPCMINWPGWRDWTARPPMAWSKSICWPWGPCWSAKADASARAKREGCLITDSWS